VLPTAPEPQSDRFVLPSSPQAPATHAAAAHTAGPSTAAEQNLALLFQAAEQAQSAQSVAGAVEPTQQALAPQGSPAEATSNLPAALTSVTLVPTLPLPGSTAHAGQAAQLEAMHRHLQQQLQTQQEVHFRTLHQLHAQQLLAQQIAVLQSNGTIEAAAATHAAPALGTPGTPSLSAAAADTQAAPAPQSVQGVHVQSVQGVQVQGAAGVQAVQQLVLPVLSLQTPRCRRWSDSLVGLQAVGLQAVQLVGMHEGRPVMQMVQSGVAPQPAPQLAPEGTKANPPVGSADASAFSRPQAAAQASRAAAQVKTEEG